MNTKFRIGQHVLLPANEAEDWPEERATVLEVPRRPGKPYTVIVDEEFRGLSDDDGLREVGADDIRPLEVS